MWYLVYLLHVSVNDECCYGLASWLIGLMNFGISKYVIDRSDKCRRNDQLSCGKTGKSPLVYGIKFKPHYPAHDQQHEKYLGPRDRFMEKHSVGKLYQHQADTRPGRKSSSSWYLFDR